MILQHCSINGKKYKIHNFGVQEENNSNVLRLPHYDRDVLIFFQTLSICHTVQIAKLDQIKQDDNEAVEKSFEIVDSSGSVDDVEDVKQQLETLQNTKQNEVSVPDNLLQNLPVAVERMCYIKF